MSACNKEPGSITALLSADTLHVMGGALTIVYSIVYRVSYATWALPEKAELSTGSVVRS
jgi:hypothetical protein